MVPQYGQAGERQAYLGELGGPNAVEVALVEIVVERKLGGDGGMSSGVGLIISW